MVSEPWSRDVQRPVQGLLGLVEDLVVAGSSRPPEYKKLMSTMRIVAL
jgi:hypothetical protein